MRDGVKRKIGDILFRARGVHDALSTINRFGFLMSPFFPCKFREEITAWAKGVAETLKKRASGRGSLHKSMLNPVYQ